MKKLIDYLKIGDKVFDITTGWGTVTGLEHNRIFVKFRDNLGRWYEADGTMYHNNKNPSLFLEEIKLEQNLPEFVEGDIVLGKRRIYCEIYDVWYDEWITTIYKRKDKAGNYVCRNINNPVLEMMFLDVKSFDKSHFETK